MNATPSPHGSADARPTHDVRHDATRHRFECDVEGQRCVADYVPSPSVLHMTHTGVPRALEGRGIAAALVAAAFGYARAHGLKIDPQCSYVRTYFQRHPETHDLRA